MHCPSCNFENEPDAQFCEECGSKLVLVCPECGREVRPTAKFCSKCGTSLTAVAVAVPHSSSPLSPATPASQLPERRSAEAERRQLTVMFCDLVDSTALSAQLDPEELREVVRLYQETCTTVIQRYEGDIAQHLGDGLLVYFGYPMAHEDDAQRAVRAGIEIIDALRASPLQNKQLSHPLQVRIGIHTGLVVIGEIGSSEKREMLALGETPNLAARLQGTANPDEVVISTATYHLVEGLFECEARGQPELKGISTPVSVYRVIGESTAQNRFEVAVGVGLTPLVGREEELGLLQRRWEHAKNGNGQVVLLNGEPGIGKSRLVQALKEQVLAEGATRIEFRCSPYHQNSAFYPIIEYLQRLLQFAQNEPLHIKRAKLQQALATYRFPQADTLPLVAALLSLPHPEGESPLTLSPQKQKQKTQETLVAWIIEETEKAAVACAWEDLHWVDPSTLEVLTLFLEQIPTTRMFIILTFRPDFTPPWSPRSYLTLLTLSRLDRPQVEMMVENVTGGKVLPTEVVQQIVAKTDGVPLFVEELSKMVVESGLVREVDGHYELVGPLPPLAIPATLQDSLMARLDRLATVREVTQLGATLGREFSYEVMQAVSPVDEAGLQQALAKLVDAEVLYQRGRPPQARYLFKHALIQDAAYQSLLKSTRRQYHRQIAHAFAKRFPETTEAQPELVAHHYTEAGLSEQAIPYWQHAGQRAVERSANVEAIRHLTTGLALLQPLPETPQRVQQELGLQLLLGAAYLMTRGNTVPEVGHAYNRAHALCQQLGNTPQLIPALFGLYRFYYGRADYLTARQLGEQLISVVEQGQDIAVRVLAHYALGTCLYQLGEAVLARTHLERGMRCYDPTQHHSLAFHAGIDPGVGSHSYGACVLWLLGYPDQALSRRQEALSLAEALAHLSTQAHTFLLSAFLSLYGREASAAQECAERVITLSREQGNAFYLAQAIITRGWALAAQGRAEDGIAAIQQGLATLRAHGAEAGWTLWHTVLAQAYATGGQTEEGLTAVAEGLAAVERNSERFWEAELYRLKGDLLLMQDRNNQQEAAKCFQKATAIAQQQHTKSWELRASTSLARLWLQQGRRAEARQLLAEIYGWFTEGFDTKDLKDAKSLLDELSLSEQER